MPNIGLTGVRELRCRRVELPLGAGPAPGRLIDALAGESHLVAFIGEWAGGGAIVASEPLAILDDPSDPFAAVAVQPTLEGADTDDFFGGGWIGWFGYDAAPFLAFYDHVLRHRDGQWWFEALWSDERDGVLIDRLAALRSLVAGAAARPEPTSRQLGTFVGPSMLEHLGAVERAVEWIRAGEVYQVNVCTRFEAAFAGNPAALFAQAADRLAPRFGAYLAGREQSVACLSPELFLRRRGRVVTTSPIKGTAPRDEESGADVLRQSVKDAAENVMIVDLMRNDLGRVCEIGSVHPATLLDIEPHPGVWHLVSTVTGTVRPDVDDADLLRATFPPGSVTGAPKVRALDAIAELERIPRGVYTGAVGFVSPSWGLEFAVAIRTFEIDRNRIALGVGGGVTADSVPIREWRECLDKAAPLLAALGAQLDPSVTAPGPAPTDAQYGGGLLETILIADGEPVRLADHLARLDRSSRELYGRGLRAGTAAHAAAAARQHPGGRGALRLVLKPDGEIEIGCTEIGMRAPESDLRVVRGRGGLWRHKWGDRSALALFEEGAGAPLFVADDETVLETSRGNVFLICSDGSLRTAPLRDDLLPGITRRAILDIARDTGRVARLQSFTVDDMVRHAAFWTSSLSEVVAINSVDGITLPRRDDDITQLLSALRARAPHRAHASEKLVARESFVR